jgi:hypothetical protein
VGRSKTHGVSFSGGINDRECDSLRLAAAEEVDRDIPGPGQGLEQPVRLLRVFEVLAIDPQDHIPKPEPCHQVARIAVVKADYLPALETAAGLLRSRLDSLEPAAEPARHRAGQGRALDRTIGG